MSGSGGRPLLPLLQVLRVPSLPRDISVRTDIYSLSGRRPADRGNVKLPKNKGTLINCKIFTKRQNNIKLHILHHVYEFYVGICKFTRLMEEYVSSQDVWKRKEERQLTQQVLVSTDKSVSCLPVPSAAGG